jgi:hypothetical protein
MASFSRSLAGGGVAGSALAWFRRSATPGELNARTTGMPRSRVAIRAGEPAGPADGVHDIRGLTAPARPARVTERGYAGQQFRVTPLAGRADRDVHDAQAAAEFGDPARPAELLRVHGHRVPLPGEDTGELAESGVVRARARAGARVSGGGMLRDDGDLHRVPPGWRIFVTVSCQGDGNDA